MDIKSTQVQHPVSNDELDHQIECLEKLRQTPAKVQEKQAKTFVISPFRKIARACRNRAKQKGFNG